uniref:CUB domain-containing protein n=1 Tax=Syphacia muris TaxID=451379 RepID=A0A0N5AEB8_9BILA
MIRLIIVFIVDQRINLQTGEVEVKHIGKTDSEIVIPESDRVVTASAGVNVCQQYRTLTYESDVFYCITDYCNKANTVCAGLEQQGSSMLSCYNCNINFQRYVDSEPVRCSTSISLPANGYCVYHRVIDTTTNRVTISYRAQPSAEVALPDGTLVNNANGNSQCISRSGNGYESQTFFCQSNFCNDYNSVCRALSVSGDYNKPDDNAAPSASLRILFEYIFDRSSKSVRIERRLLSQPFMTTPGQKQISVVGKCITSFESQYRIESYICNSDYCNTDCNDEVLVPGTVNGYVEPLRSCIKGAEVLLQDDRYQQLYINSNSGCQQSFENGVMYYTSVCNGNRCNFDCYSSTAVTPVFNISSIPTTNSALSSAELFGTSLLIAVTTAIYRLLVHI